ncbi:MAG TPA: Rrf2 family transcriptional regulator [bacterium]|nr:Rrf2 family transcriptional regulator [bacterium]
MSEAANLAIHALAYMATLGAAEPVSAQRIAEDLRVSESHLSKVLQKLARDGLIESTRGAKGGFFFAKKPDKLTLLDILVAVDGPLPTHGCLLGKPLCTTAPCRLKGLQDRVTEMVGKELGKIKLIDLVLKPAQKLKTKRTS